MRTLLNKALLLLLLSLAAFQASAANCDLEPPFARDSQVSRVKVQKVIDGDTLRLQDGRLVRLIGVNTPEIDHENGDSEPLAETARDFLQALIDRQQAFILLHYDSETQDSHGRQLAHVFSPQGSNIQAQLIANGLGIWITVPPNLRYLDCYRAQEQQSRQQHRGIWAAQYRAPRETASLGRRDRGFVWMQGTVTRIGQGKKYIWLNFGEGIAAQVHKDDLQYFPDPTFSTLKNKTVSIKGWLFPYKNQMVMRLRHPASMDVLD